jgi:D-alanine transaminase
MTRELIARNGGGDLYIYLQVSRGADVGRNPAPLPDLHTVFAFCAPLPQQSADTKSRGIPAVTANDTRWARCDIKSVALLPNVLLRQQAVDAGAAETLLLRDGQLTEASSATVHVVIDTRLVTPPPSAQILPGTTRDVVELLADRCGIARRTATIAAGQLRSASEIMISSSLREVLPVTQLDGQTVGTGRPGPVWQRLRAEFDRYKQEVAATPW